MLLIYLIPIILIIVIVIILKDERRTYKSINFKEKKLYLCCKFLYGNCNLKTNIAVLSRSEDNFLIETEDKEGIVESFSFNVSEILDIKVKEGLSSKSGTQLSNNHETSTKMGSQTSIESVKTLKLYKEYNIKIELKNGIHMCILSTKDPDYIFRENKS